MKYHYRTEELDFSYRPVDFTVKCYFRNGEWGEIEVSDNDEITIPVAATGMQYGQAAFEGVKAYRHEDGKIRVFRMKESAQRLACACEGIVLAKAPEDLFCRMVKKLIELNEDYVPEWGSGCSLYIRPVLFGITPRVKVIPSDEYVLTMCCSPVGDYFKCGFKASPYMLVREYDRAAPLGTGLYKVGGNYAASFRAAAESHRIGCLSEIFLDAKEKNYIDECSSANFFAIKGNTYVTPLSSTILPSITNRSLMALAEDMGMTIERRRIAVDELNSFDEVATCGTAAVVAPVSKIVDPVKGVFYEYGDEPGKVCTALYKKLVGVQFGKEADIHSWLSEV